jgi:sulfur-carrier protein adenylyltransferase/sulfurtransferase
MALPDPLPLEIPPAELARARAEGAACAVLDVREPWELEVAGLEDVVHIPLGLLPARAAELPRDRPIVVICRSGRRSLQATRFLRDNGFPKVTNLEGGLLAWAEDIDPTMTRY